MEKGRVKSTVTNDGARIVETLGSPLVLPSPLLLLLLPMLLLLLLPLLLSLQLSPPPLAPPVDVPCAAGVGAVLGGASARLYLRDVGGRTSKPYKMRTTPEGEASREAKAFNLEQPDWDASEEEAEDV